MQLAGLKAEQVPVLPGRSLSLGVVENDAQCSPMT